MALLNVSADTYTYGDYTYTVSGSRATIIGYSGVGGTVVIPSNVSSYRVVSIGNAAFKKQTSILSVKIPDTIETIGASAFEGCTGLTSITLPEAVESIGSRAFYDCTNVTELHYDVKAELSFTDSKYKLYSVFGNIGKYGTGVTVYFGSSVTKVPNYMFYSVDSETYNVNKVVFEGTNIRTIGQNSLCCDTLVSAVYCGCETQWQNITVKSGNETLKKMIMFQVSHDSGLQTVYQKPTCDRKGYTAKVCGNCGEVISREDIPAFGHRYDSGVVTTKSTCVEEGVKTFTCATCKHTHTEAIPALGHTEKTVTVDATCENDGYKAVVCEVCGEELSREAISAKGHGYADGVCTVCGGKDPNAVPAVLLGDLNGDGKINARDYMVLKSYVLKRVELADEQIPAADVNRDGRVNAADYMILKAVVLRRATI